jgi:hypothetical protein
VFRVPRTKAFAAKQKQWIIYVKTVSPFWVIPPVQVQLSSPINTLPKVELKKQKKG